MRMLALFVLSFALIAALTPRSASASAGVSHQAHVCASMDCAMSDMCKEAASACALCCAAACAVAASPAREASTSLGPAHSRFAQAPAERVRGRYPTHDPPVPR